MSIRLYAAGFFSMNEVSNDRAMNKLQASVYASFLAAIFVSVNSFGASLFGERVKNAPSAAAKISGKLIISGSNTMAPLILEIAKRFEALHPGTQIEVHKDGLVQGLSDIRQRKASIAMLTRALTDKESDLKSYPVARDGVCVIVHKDNPVKLLTSQQVIDINVGRIVNWNKVGGSNAGVDVINGASGSGTVDIFIQYFKIKYEEISPRMVLRSSTDRIKAVAENRNAISYVSIGEAERKMKAGVPIRLLPAEGVSATAKSLRSGNFPIARPLTLITMGTENELTKEFIRYALSPNVTGIIEMNDFVPYQD